MSVHPDHASWGVTLKKALHAKFCQLLLDNWSIRIRHEVMDKPLSDQATRRAAMPDLGAPHIPNLTSPTDFAMDTLQ